MKMLTIVCCTGLLLLASCATDQDRQSKDRIGHDKEDLYVPRDLDDCFVQLKTLLKPEDVEAMKSGTEADMSQYHFGLGMWVRNNWGLWGGSRLAKWFNALGIEHPDDMSAIILDSFWRHLNDQPIKMAEQVTYYKQYWLEATPPQDPCPHCGSKLSWVGGGGDAGHAFECDKCQLGFRYHYQRGFRQVPISKEKAREKADMILRERQMSADLVVMDDKAARFRTFEVKKDEGCSLAFGRAGFGMGSTDCLVWQFAWRGQDIEEPLDNLMWIEIDAETAQAKIWFAVLKSEERDHTQKAQPSGGAYVAPEAGAPSAHP